MATPSNAATGAASSYEQWRRAEEDGNNDLECGAVPMANVFLALGSSPRGLSSAAAASRLAATGTGQTRTWKQSRLLKLVPLAVETAAAVAMAIGLVRGGGYKAADASIAALVAADFITGFAERSSAEGAAAPALLSRLAPPSRRTWVRRDGVWSEQEAAELVPGDVIRMAPRDAVPADAILLVVDNGYSPQQIRIDQSALTGDPAPAAKLPGDDVYAGSACANGEAEAVVVTTRAQTHLQQAVLLNDATMYNIVVWMCGPVWNVFVVAVCFNFVADVVAGKVSHNLGGEIVAMVFIAFLFAISGCFLSKLSESDPRRCRRRPERDPEELMRRLEVLWENGSISEETLRRCRDLFGVEPVSAELVTTLAEHFGWRAMGHEDGEDEDDRAA
jgi:magnesium-transporting ATPase (P-type)